MAIDDLMRVMPPPAAPKEADDTRWHEVEKQIGTALPNDFKQFIGTYGSGRINDFIWMLNPFSHRKNINLIEQQSRQLNALRTLINDFGERCPYALFPEPGGLLPCGFTDDGDIIHWLTSGVPSEWGVIVNDSRGPQYAKYDLSLTEFLFRIVDRIEVCPIFPRGFPIGGPRFEAM
jgi:hypothetical protein